MLKCLHATIVCKNIPSFSISLLFSTTPYKMARTAMTNTNNKGKVKKGTQKKPGQKEQKTKERRSFSIRKPNITASQSAKKTTKKPRSIVLKEIRFYQKSTNFLVSKSPFTRMVRDITRNIARNANTDTPRFTAQSLEILQEVFEAHLTTLMETSYLASRHAKRVTLYPSDIKLINKVRGGNNI